MIRDGFLKFASSQTLADKFNSILGLGIGSFYPLPAPVDLNIAHLDLQVATDIGQGTKLVARLDVEEDFDSSETDMLVSFAVGVRDNATGIDVHPIAIGEPILVGSWVKGAMQELVIPTLPSALADGRRYLFLGLFVQTAIAAGNNLFTAGKVSAQIVATSQPDAKRHASGFSFKPHTP